MPPLRSHWHHHLANPPDRFEATAFAVDNDGPRRWPWRALQLSEVPLSGFLCGHLRCPGSVLDSPGWYTNFDTPDDTVVIFPGRVFRYPRGDDAARAEAEAFAATLGIPASQLD